MFFRAVKGGAFDDPGLVNFIVCDDRAIGGGQPKDLRHRNDLIARRQLEGLHGQVAYAIDLVIEALGQLAGEGLYGKRNEVGHWD